MSLPGIEPQTPCTIGRYSRKEPSRQLILLSIQSPTLFGGFPTHYMAPPSICVMLRTMLTHNTHILNAGVQRSLFHDLTEWTSVLRFTEDIHFLWWSDHVGVTTIENLDQRYLYPLLERTNPHIIWGISYPLQSTVKCHKCLVGKWFYFGKYYRHIFWNMIN